MCPGYIIKASVQKQSKAISWQYIKIQMQKVKILAYLHHVHKKFSTDIYHPSWLFEATFTFIGSKNGAKDREN